MAVSSSSKINQEVTAFNNALLMRGTVMVALSAIVIQLIVAFYLMTSLGIFSEKNHALISFSALTYLLAMVLLYWAKGKLVNIRLVYSSAILITFSWCLLALVVDAVWHEAEAAKRLLLIAFFISFLAWYPKIRLLFLTLPLIIFSYAYIEFNSVNTSFFDQALILLKFPLFIVIFYFTIGKLFHRAQLSYIENLSLVEELQRTARTDTLTNIGNRLKFNEELAFAINASQRLEAPLTLVILDIDFFKQYNDMLGHPAGDKCLQQVAALFDRQCQRAVDTVTRIGGEEFAMILTGSSLKQASSFISKVQQELDQAAIMHPRSKISSYVTVSAGLAQFENDDAESLYRKADSALYQAKQSGRNCYVSAVD